MRRNRLETSRQFVVCAVVSSVAAFLSPQAVAADCTCTPEIVLAQAREAKRIVKGRIVSAHISSSERSRIDFVVDIDKTIVGPATDTAALYTSLPEDCGSPLRLGNVDTFAVLSKDGLVGSCSGFKNFATRHKNLLALIDFIDYSRKKDKRAARWLNRHFDNSDSMKDVIGFLYPASALYDRNAELVKLSDSVQFGSVRVSFADGRFARAQAVHND